MPNSGELEWDIRRQRIEQIAHWVNLSERELNNWYRERSVEAADDWMASIQTLWMSIKYYVDEEEDGEEDGDRVDDMIKDLEDILDADNPAKKLEEEWKLIDDLHTKVHKLRIKNGLDIPTKTSLDPEKAGVEGLED